MSTAVPLTAPSFTPPVVATLRYLGYGLAVILAFIGTKLALHWGHLQWEQVPEIPTLWSLAVIVVVLTVTTVTSLAADRRSPAAPEHETITR